MNFVANSLPGGENYGKGTFTLFQLIEGLCLFPYDVFDHKSSWLVTHTTVVHALRSVLWQNFFLLEDCTNHERGLA